MVASDAVLSGLIVARTVRTPGSVAARASSSRTIAVAYPCRR
jgi:hypothetical protein